MKRFLTMVLLLTLVFVPMQSTFAATKVVFWNNFSGGDGEFMSAMVEEFNTAHPHIEIEVSGVTWDDYYNRLLTSVAGGIGPDVAIMHTTHVPAYANQGMLTPLDAELDKRNIDTDDYVEGPWTALQYEGKQYGIPLDVHPWVLFYNKTILAELDLLNADGDFTAPTNPADFRSLIDTLQEAGHYSLSAEYAGGGGWRGWFALLKQAGGELFSGNEVLVNGEIGKETLTWWSSIPLDYPELVVEYDESVALFAEGDAALHYNGVWATGYYEQIEGLDFGVIPFPTLYSQDAGWGNSHSFVLPVQRSAVSEEKYDAILEFVEWMTANSYKWALAGHIPTRHSVLDSEEFNALAYRPDYAAQSETVVYLPQHINVLEIETVLSEEAMAAALGAKPIDDALAAMEKAIQSLIR